MGLSHVIPELMKKIININNGNLDVYSVEHKRTFCFITDAVEMIQKLAESNLTTGKAYNVGNQDEEISMGDLARKIIILLDKKIKINSMPPTAGSPERRCPSIDKLNNVIKEINLEDGYVLSKYRESRDENKQKTFLSGNDRLEVIKGMPVWNTISKQIEKI